LVGHHRVLHAIFSQKIFFNIRLATDKYTRLNSEMETETNLEVPLTFDTELSTLGLEFSESDCLLEDCDFSDKEATSEEEE